MKAIGELAPTLFADRQARSGLMPPWANGKAAKEYRAVMGNKPVGGIFSMGVEEAYRWKDSVQSEAEIRIWFADGVANGLRPWFTKFAGVLRDRRWLGVIEDLYRWHHGAERYLRNEEPLARVGLVYSQQTAWFYGGPEAENRPPSRRSPGVLNRKSGTTPTWSTPPATAQAMLRLSAPGAKITGLRHI